jgi:hypothetical protein
MARRRYQRKSHLAEAIKQSSPGWQVFWKCVIVIVFVVTMAAYFSH